MRECFNFYDLLDVKSSRRIRVVTHADEIHPISSVVSIFSSVNWWERRNWGLFGVLFSAAESVQYEKSKVRQESVRVERVLDRKRDKKKVDQ